MSNTKKAIAVIPAALRDQSGKGISRSLRREGKIPGVLYSKGKEAVRISLPLKEVAMEYAKGRFSSRLLELKFADKTIKALPKDLQFNPVTDMIEHVDFIGVEAGSTLRVNVPVKVTGQERSVGLKRGGVYNIVRHEIEFICLPDAIPTHIEINIQAVDIGHSVHINDIELPKGVTPAIKRNFTIVTIAGRGKAEEEAPVATAAAATPAVGAAAAAPAAAAKKEAPKKK
ncbi:MAG: 50S ribosomal protein L25/general stress protein Ctc [Pseudomonadota bacterium]